jgi:hypothetical protein
MEKQQWHEKISQRYLSYIGQQRGKSIGWSYKRKNKFKEEEYLKYENSYEDMIKHIFPWVYIKEIRKHRPKDKKIGGATSIKFIGSVVLAVKSLNEKVEKIELFDDFIQGDLLFTVGKRNCSKVTIDLSANLFSPQVDYFSWNQKLLEKKIKNSGIDSDDGYYGYLSKDGIFHNEECAKYNQPLLEKSLRMVEKELDMEFDECFAEHGANKNLIWKYGFK